MATTKKTGAAGEAAALPDATPWNSRKPMHEAFKWVDTGAIKCGARMPAHAGVSFINKTRDIAGGVSTILEILERCAMDADEEPDGERPMFSLSDQSSLMRLAIASLDGLRDSAEGLTSWAHEQMPAWNGELGK